MPSFTAANLRGQLYLGREPIDHLSAIFARHLHLVLGRHFAVAQNINNFQPPIHIFSVCKVWIQGIDAEIGLLLYLPVTLITGFFQYWSDLSTVSFEIRFGRSRVTRTNLLIFI